MGRGTDATGGASASGGGVTQPLSIMPDAHNPLTDATNLAVNRLPTLPYGIVILLPLTKLKPDKAWPYCCLSDMAAK